VVRSRFLALIGISILFSSAASMFSADPPAKEKTQTKEAAASAKDAPKKPPLSEAEKLQAALNAPSYLWVSERSLNDAITILQNRHKIQFDFAPTLLSKNKDAKQTPLTINLSGISLRSLMNLLTRQLDIGWMIRNNTVVLTTKEEAAKAAAEAKKAAENEEKTAATPDASKPPAKSPREIAIEKALDNIVSGNIEGISLKTLVDYLKNMSNIEIYLDERDLKSIGVTPDTPIRIMIGENVSVERLLEQLTEKYDITWTIQDEVLFLSAR
jgi:hypothetical protein